MRICLITNLYSPYARGGAERVVETIAKELYRKGESVTVVTTVSSWSANIKAFFRGGWLRETRDGITVYRVATANLFPYWTIGTHNVLLRLVWHVFDLFAVETAFIIKKLLQQEKPDVVMTHNLMGLGFLIPRTIRRLGIQHVHTVHDVQLAVPSGLLAVGKRPSIILAAGLQLYERLLRWLIGSPSVVISPSQWLCDFYTERGFFSRSKKAVLHNPIVTPLSEQRRRCIPLVSSGYNFLRFLYVGQLEKHKGIIFLLDAIKKLEIGNWKLEIIGSGSLLSRIQKEAQSDSRITIHGAVPHEKLSEFYGQADALIVPSLVHENAPTVIFEALAHGLPIIASRVGGVPEFVRDEETGWLFTSGDASDFLRVVEQILKDRQQLDRVRMHMQTLPTINTPERYSKTLLSLV